MEQKDYSVIAGLLGGDKDASQEAYRKMHEWEAKERREYYVVITQDGRYMQVPCVRPDGTTAFCAVTELNEDFLKALLGEKIDVGDVESSDGMVAHIEFSATVRYRPKTKL